jgi:hypothetical protein
MFVEICDGKQWSILSGPTYGSSCHPAASCAQVFNHSLELFGNAGESQLYTLDVDGSADEIWCDAETSQPVWDGRSKNRAAPSCGSIFSKYPGKLVDGNAGGYWIGSTGKAELQTCTPKLDSRVPQDGILAWWKMEMYHKSVGQWESVVAPDGADESDRMLVDFITDAAGYDVRSGGGGAHDGYLGLHGNAKVGQRLSFGDIAQSVGTLCTTARYEPGGSQGRIFNGGRSNWLHSHWGGYAKCAHYDGWYVHPHRPPALKTTDWVVMCSTNGGDQESWVNGADNAPLRASSTAVSNTWNQGEVYVGPGGRLGLGNHPNEHSEFRLGEVIAWKRGFSSDELRDVTQYLIDRLAGNAK